MGGTSCTLTAIADQNRKLEAPFYDVPRGAGGCTANSSPPAMGNTSLRPAPFAPRSVALKTTGPNSVTCAVPWASKVAALNSLRGTFRPAFSLVTRTDLRYGSFISPQAL